MQIALSSIGTPVTEGQSSEIVEYTDCISEEW